MMDGNDKQTVEDVVRERYGSVARLVLEGLGQAASCCSPQSGGSCCSSANRTDPITSGLYSAAEASGVPEEALLASLGCGNPTALAELKPGEVVLDLGSGGGIDVLLSARRVGPTGLAYGLDMTDEMLELAEKNRVAAGVENVRFLKGRIEEIPLPDRSVDVILSNCVINLSADKDRVFREAFRVLKPGGRLAVSDIVWTRPVAEALRRDLELWVGCIAGALERDEYTRKLRAAGFTGISVQTTRVYSREDLADLVGSAVPYEDIDGALISAFIRAHRPCEAR